MSVFYIAIAAFVAIVVVIAALTLDGANRS